MSPRPPNDDLDYAALDRFFAGECSPADEARIRAWIAAGAGRSNEIERLRAIWQAGAALPPDVEAALRRVTGGEASAIARARAPSRRIGWIVSAIAAGLLIAAVGVQTRRMTNRWDYVTRVGQRQMLTLADGTQLTLAPDSRIRLAPDYGIGRRELTLQGEAYLVVVHDTARPLAIRVGRAVVTDIGTHFGVRAYAADTVVRVVVAEGSVSVVTDTLKAGDMAVLHRAGGATVTHGVDTETYLGWRTGQLTFSNAPVRDVLPELARWYGVRIEPVDSALGGRPLTASFRDQPVGDVVGAVAAAIGATAVWHGNTVALEHSSTPGAP